MLSIMKKRVIKNGGSLGVTFHKEEIDYLGIKKGDLVEITIKILEPKHAN